MHRTTIIAATSAVFLTLGWVRLKATDAPPPEEFLQAQLGQMSQDIHQLARTVRGLSSQVDGLETQRSAWHSDEVMSRIDQLDAEVLDRYSGLVQTVNATASLVEETGRDLTHLHDQLLPESGQLWQGLLGPTVQLASPMTVGTGVLLPVRADCPVRVLTAWHVVRDILSDSGEGRAGVPIRIYDRDGTARSAAAMLLVYDNALDACLLELVGAHTGLEGATLPTRGELSRMRVFDPVYAVGCPLGSDPVPSQGALSDLNHHVDGRRYWMINAPTFIGNSGGGIFGAHNLALLGIVSKLYTHGSHQTVVPHMGLVTPLTDIYDWFDRCGYGELIPN